MEIRIIAEGYPGIASDGSLTFVGVLRKYFGENEKGQRINKFWNGKTQDLYIKDYEQRLIIMLENDKPLHLYEEEDFIDVLRKIKKRGNYTSDETINHYRNLIWRVYKAGLDNNLYNDKLFWKELKLIGKSEDEKELRKRLLTTKKSFAIDEEKKLLGWFCDLDPTKASGQEIGIALMFFFGMRNQEACGLNYKAIKLLTKEKLPCVYIYQTTIVGKNILKAGGKTSNAMRIIPMFDFFYDFLDKRIKFLERRINDGEEILEQGRKDINDLPIVCKDNHYGTRCKSSDLTDLGRNIFKDLGIGKDAQIALHKELFLQRLNEVDVGEKDPTAYLFRRNFATHLYLLGFSASEIQYLLGHDVESPVEARNFFANEDNVVEIQKKLESHPYRIFFNGFKSEPVLLVDNHYRSGSKSVENLCFSTSTLNEKFLIQVNACEPLDDIKLSFDESDGSEYSVIKSHFYNSDGYNQTVNIRNVINENYKKHFMK